MANNRFREINKKRAFLRKQRIKADKNIKGSFFKNNIVEIIIAIIASFFLSSIISNNIFFVGYVPSASMNPILQKGDRTFVKVHNIKMQRGNIYVFKNVDELMVKRCIGIGGDHIVIDNNNIYLNGELIDEPYVGSENRDEIKMELIVPEGKYFFLGDNRGNSYDSRYWENPFIDRNDIEGQCKMIINPIKRINKL